MRVYAERGFLWCTSLAVVAFVLATVGLNFDILQWLPWVLLAGAAVAVGAMVAQAGGVSFKDNRFSRHFWGLAYNLFSH